MCRCVWRLLPPWLTGVFGKLRSEYQVTPASTPLLSLSCGCHDDSLDTYGGVVLAQRLLTDGQGIVQQMGGLLVFVLVPVA